MPAVRRGGHGAKCRQRILESIRWPRRPPPAAAAQTTATGAAAAALRGGPRHSAGRGRRALRNRPWMPSRSSSAPPRTPWAQAGQGRALATLTAGWATPQAQPRHPRRRSTGARRAPALAGPSTRRSNTSAGHRAPLRQRTAPPPHRGRPDSAPNRYRADKRLPEGDPGAATPRPLVAAPERLPARPFSRTPLRHSRRCARDAHNVDEAPRRRGEPPASGASPDTEPPRISAKP